MIRGWRVLGVLALAVTIVASIAVPRRQVVASEALTVNAEYIARAAAKPMKDSPTVFDQLSAFVTVVETPDGSRYIIIDRRAKDAPAGELIIDGRLFDEYTTIKVIGVPAITNPGESTPVTGADVGVNNWRDGNGQWWMDWHEEWIHLQTVYEDFDYWQTGEAGYGCANATDEDRNISCSLEKTSSYTTQVDSQLTASRLLNLGFSRTYGQTVRETFTINPVRAHSIYVATPMARRFKKGWNERQLHKQCKTASGWSWWCTGPQETIHNHTRYALGKKPVEVFAELSRRSYP